MKLHISVSLLLALATLGHVSRAASGGVTQMPYEITISQPAQVQEHSVGAWLTPCTVKLEQNIEFTPENSSWWKNGWDDGSDLFQYAYHTFTSANAGTPVSLAFTNPSAAPAFFRPSVLEFHALSGLKFSGSGVAIWGWGDMEALSISNVSDNAKGNADVVFDGTSMAMHTSYDDSFINISNNGGVSFCNNLAWDSSYAIFEVIHGAAFNMDNNEFVSFINNGGARHEGNYGSPGAFALGSTPSASISGNGAVVFDGNYVGGIEGCMDGRFGSGAAISLSQSTLDMCNNESVTFSNNRVHSTEGSEGGAIYVNSWSILNINNNGEVLFEANMANYGLAAFGSGGAISVNSCSTLCIAGNDSVIFQKNLMRDPYKGLILEALGIAPDCHLILSAKTGGNIVFYDRVIQTDYYTSDGTVSLNADYTDENGVIQKAQGDIIFSGEYTEKYLQEGVAQYNERYDKSYVVEEENIAISRTSQFNTKVTLYGGSLQVVSKAELKTLQGLTVVAGSQADVIVDAGTLTAGESDIEVNSSAALVLRNGAAVSAGSIYIEHGATLSVSGQELPATLTLGSAAEPMAQVFNQPVGVSVDGDLFLKGGSTLELLGTHIELTDTSTLNLLVTSDDKIRLVLTMGTSYDFDEEVVLFSGVNEVNFTLDEESLSETSMRADMMFVGDGIDEDTILYYDSANQVLSLRKGDVTVPEPASATLSLLALAAMVSRRRRK